MVLRTVIVDWGGKTERPARMRQARYDKLRAKAEAASEASMAALWAYLDRVDPRWRNRRVGA